MAERVSIPKMIRDDVFNHLLGKCAYCGVDLHIFNFVVEHQFPLSKGGTNERHNLLPSCDYCNQKKGVKTLYEFWVKMGYTPDKQWIKRAECNYPLYSCENGEWLFHFYYEYAYDQDLFIPVKMENDYA